MTLFISHTTAALYWLYAKEKPHYSKCVPQAKGGFDKEALSAFLTLPVVKTMPPAFPVEAIAASRTRSIKEATVHFSGTPFPPNSFAKLATGVFIASPELTFLQMATVLPFSRLVEYGCALCGTFTYNSSEKSGRSDRKPLTSVERIRKFANSAANLAGKRNALRALRSVRDGSNSPKESQLFILLCAPNLQGGYAAKAGEFNTRIDISKRNSLYKSKQFYSVDLYWDSARLAVEYDSDAEHLGNAVARDAKKRLALEEDGIDIVTVTLEQLMSFREMDKIGRAVRKHLGQYGQPRVHDFEKRKALLRKELLLGENLPELLCTLGNPNPQGHPALSYAQTPSESMYEVIGFSL